MGDGGGGEGAGGEGGGGEGLGGDGPGGGGVGGGGDCDTVVGGGKGGGSCAEGVQIKQLSLQSSRYGTVLHLVITSILVVTSLWQKSSH